MRAESRKFLYQLLETPSPSGFEQPVQRIIRKRMKPFADQILSDVHGNTIVALNPEKSPRVMLAGHVDQIGFMVRYITNEGYIHFGSIGGIDASVVPGLVLTAHGARRSVDGVVGRKAIHHLTPEERRKAQVDIKELWLDIGAKDKQQIEKHLNVGDPITYKLGVIELGDELIASPGTDDKVGAFVVMEALRWIHASGRRCPCGVFAVATVQEEIGLRGARTSSFGLDPQVGIAVDVTHAADYPGADKKISGDLALGRGPAISVGPNINPVLGRLLTDTARKKKIPFQLEAQPSASPTDANVIQVTRGGVASALLSIPNRYMHTPVEVVNLKDIENAAKLLADACLQITKKMDFVPR